MLGSWPSGSPSRRSCCTLGSSSPELHEPPVPERFEVPAATARLVQSARKSGQRVIAVDTPVVRALETAARPHGGIRPASGWTDLVLGPDRPARIVTVA